MSATVGAAIVETDVLVIGASAAQLFFREVDRRGGPTPSTVSEIIAANKRALDHCTSDP